MAGVSSTEDARPLKRRRAPSLLVDPRFQLKYTGLLVGVVLAVMLALGVVIWRTAGVASASAELAAKQAERALKESDTSARILRMSAATLGPDAEALNQALEAEQAESDRAYQRELSAIAERRAHVEQQRGRLLALLVGGGAALLALLAGLGVFITHRIVGPVFRLKRLCRQVGTTRLDVKVELRRGDELEDLFDTFRQMTYSLKALQLGRLATLDATLQKAEAARVPEEVLVGLRALRAQLCLGLGDEQPSEKPRAAGK
ncbi:MAG: HAMP domain-containing protein [Polyangiaceae bacterium]|nr:HAMP domain-containing protein [Polyangiaceae bacterium]